MNAQTEDGWYDPNATTFGDRVAGAREQAGMSQACLLYTSPSPRDS